MVTFLGSNDHTSSLGAFLKHHVKCKKLQEGNSACKRPFFWDAWYVTSSILINKYLENKETKRN